MAQFTELSPVIFPDDPDLESAINSLVQELNTKLRVITAEQSDFVASDRGARLDRVDAVGEGSVDFNVDLTTSVAGGKEVKLAEFSVPVDRPLLMLVRGVFEDAQAGASLAVKMRVGDLNGPVMDEISVTSGSAWTVFEVQTKSVEQQLNFGPTSVSREIRTDRFVVTGVVSGASGNALVRDLKTLTVGLSS